MALKKQKIERTKKGFKMPHVFVILFMLIFIMSILTYVIPAGEYDRVPGPNDRNMVDPNSFHYVESQPVTLLQFLTSIPRGFVGAASVIAFTLILPGAFEVVKKTGLLNIVVSKLSKKFSKNGILIIPVLMIAFSLLATFVGTSELSMVYVPIILPLILMMGFDSMTAVAIPLVATSIGFTSAFTNPFTVGISQQIAGLPMFSGLWYRIIIYIILITIGILYVIRYAKKVHADPTTSLTYAIDQTNLSAMDTDVSEEEHLTSRHKGVALVFLISFIILIYGVLKKGWGMDDMAGVFIATGVLSGIVGGMKSGEICDAFIKGAGNVLSGALLIGIARGVTVVMEDALIIDTVVHGLAQLIGMLPSAINAVGMLVVQALFNFLVPSGSGQALVTMPILSPLADIVGVNQQVAVLALQFGDGLSNILYPTVGYFMATLAIAKIDWSDWIKFVGKLLIFLHLAAAILLIIAQAINYGPF